MNKALHSVIETASFMADVREAKIDDEEYANIILTIANKPLAGDIMPGTGGARKIRIAGRGKGKSGGYRVITYFGGGDIPVFALNLFSKGEKANLSPAERNALRVELQGLAEDYRRNFRK